MGLEISDRTVKGVMSYDRSYEQTEITTYYLFLSFIRFLEIILSIFISRC